MECEAHWADGYDYWSCDCRDCRAEQADEIATGEHAEESADA